MARTDIRMGAIDSPSFGAIWRGQLLVFCILGVSFYKVNSPKLPLTSDTQGSGSTNPPLLLQPVMASTGKVSRAEKGGPYAFLDDETMVERR